MYGASSLAHLLRPDWAELPILWAASLLGMPYLRESRKSKISMKLEPSPFCRGISFGWLSGFGIFISKPFYLVSICLNSGYLALAYAITAKPDSSLYPDPFFVTSLFEWLPSLPVMMLMIDIFFHSSTPGLLSLPFLHYRIDCFYAVTYIPAAAKESGAASFWSRSGLVKFFRSILEVKLETSPTAHGKGNLKIRLGYY